MPARLRLLAGTVSIGLALMMIAAPAAGAKTGDPTPVPLKQWAATFCATFSKYETDALAAQTQLRTALAGAGDSTKAAATATALAQALTKASGSAAAAATASTANGVPDLAHGKALTREVRATLESASKAYAKAAEKSSSLPRDPKKLSQAAKGLGTDIAAQLDVQGAHAKRLRRLDASSAMSGAVSTDPTCAAAAKGGGTTTPAQTTP
jgi:hypothetical protein